MKKLKLTIAILILWLTGINGQVVDSLKFFTDEEVIEASLATDIRSLQKQKGKEEYQDASIEMKFPDNTVINEKIGVAARGVMRRAYCKIPPMMLNFRNPTSPRLQSLGKLKLVIGCGQRDSDEELVFKEFLIYKMYNILEPKSFRVRLLKINYSDTKNKVKPFEQYAFLIEDDADMARRNNCKKKDEVQISTEATDRKTMTMVAIFEYMIGNTDWSVPNNQNIKLIYDRDNKNALPYVVPYDFDYSGLVNASYAIPAEVIGTESVTERVYRGFHRYLEEVQETLDIFRKKKDDIFSLVNNFTLLDNKVKSNMIDYLEEFYKTIADEKKVNSIFVENVRTN